MTEKNIFRTAKEEHPPWSISYTANMVVNFPHCDYNRNKKIRVLDSSGLAEANYMYVFKCNIHCIVSAPYVFLFVGEEEVKNCKRG